MSAAGNIIGQAAGALAGAAGVFLLTGNPFLAAAAFAVTFGSSILFAPKEPKFRLSNERKLTVRQPTAMRRMVYGETQVSGVLCYLGTTDKQRQLHMVIANASHEIDGFGDVFLNEELVAQSQLNASGLVTSGTFNNLARLKFKTGASDQTADTDLVAEVAEWTSQHRLQGIAYTYARLRSNADAFPNGIPNISVVLRGKKLFDPRDGGTRWSNNPALVLRDYLTDTKIGLGFPTSVIDDDHFSTAANICDENVDVVQNSSSVTADASTDLLTVSTSDRVLRWFRGDRVQVTATSFPGGLAGGTDYYVIPVGVFSDTKTIKLATTYANALAGTAINITSVGSGVTATRTGMPRYTCDGIVDADEKPGDVISKILSSCAGRLYYNGEKWRLLVGAYVGPDITLDENDLRGPIQVSTQLSRRERFNAVKGTYISPINDYEPTDYPPVQSATFKAQDGGERIFRDLELPFTVRPQTAQHVAKIELLRSRQPITAVFSAKLSALRLRAGDTVAVNNTALGWEEKEFDVAEYRLTAEEEDGAPYIGVDLVLRETAESIYEFSTSEEQTVDPAPNTTLPSAFAVEPPDSLTITSGSAELAIAKDGTIISQMRIAWESPQTAFVGSYEVEWKLTTETIYRGVAVGPETLQHVVSSVVDGQVYDVRVRMRNRLGVASAYVSDQHTIIGKTEPPEVPITFTIQRLADGTRRFAWTFGSPPPADVRVGGGVQIRSFVGATSDWDAMSPIHSGLLQHSPYETNDLGAGTYTFAVKTVDSSGNESDGAVFINAVLGNPRLRDVLLSSDEKVLGWPGVKTDCFITPENTLEAVSTETWDDLPATWDALANTWRAILANASPIRYETEVLDLGTDVVGTPSVSADVTGEIAIEMRTHTEAQGSDLSGETYVETTRFEGKRYVQIRVTVTGTTPTIQTLLVLIDGEVVIDDFEDVNTATETATWFESIAAGHFKLGMRKTSAVLSQAQLTALQNVGSGWDWELISKSATISGHDGPAAEFKIHNGSGALADTIVDAQLKGPRGATGIPSLVARATESNIAFPITPQTEDFVAVGQAVETDTALQLSDTGVVGIVLEADTALPLARRIAVGIAEETDTARSATNTSFQRRLSMIAFGDGVILHTLPEAGTFAGLGIDKRQHLLGLYSLADAEEDE